MILKNLLSRLCLAGVLITLLPAAPGRAQVWRADHGDGTFTNPLLWGDWPDPDVIRVGDTFYMVSTSMHYVPGLPILRSRDLVNWEMAGYALERYDDDPRYDMEGGTLYLNGAWASSIRHHRGKFYVAFCTPYGWGTQEGHFSICEADRPEGPWQRTVFPEYMYDPGLFIDDDGRAYVVHGQGTLYLTELTSDLHAVKTPAREIWRGSFGADRQLGTGGYGMEGSHVYRVGDYYYILCPAGGTEGWQICLRSRQLDGPYEWRVVMDDDSSYPGNGLHQGGMVQLQDGSWWFIIMQDRGPIGRVPCLQPVTWKDGWPILGVDGRDAITYPLPIRAKGAARKWHVATSDEFEGPRLGLQWQWNHNPRPTHWSLTERRGYMRLKAGRAADLKNARGTLTQRVQGAQCVATVEMDYAALTDGDQAGFGIFEFPYAYLAVRRQHGKDELVRCEDGTVTDSLPLPAGEHRIWFRVYTTIHAYTARFSYSTDGRHFRPLGGAFHMGLGLPWTANRYALFCFGNRESTSGYADFNWFRMSGAGQ